MAEGTSRPRNQMKQAIAGTLRGLGYDDLHDITQRTHTPNSLHRKNVFNDLSVMVRPCNR